MDSEEAAWRTEEVHKLQYQAWAQVLALSLLSHLGRVIYLSLSFPINKMEMTILAGQACGGVPATVPHT